MGGGVDLPADEDVAAGSTQVGVGDELNVAAHALDLGQDLVVPVLILLEDDDGQGGVGRGVPEERDGLLLSVAVDIHQLDGLAVFAAEGGDGLCISLFLVDAGLEIHIGLGGFGQGVHLVHIAENAAGQTQRTQHGRQADQQAFSHGRGPPFCPPVRPRRGGYFLTLYHTTILGLFLSFIFEFPAKKRLPSRERCCILSSN